MSKYFKIIEIDADEFITATGEDLACCQLVIPTNEAVFVAIDEQQEYEMKVPLGGINMLIEKNELKITPYDTPWEVACMLINAEYEAKNLLNQDIIIKFFDLDDLRRISEHILNYCNTEQKEVEGE